MDGLSVQTRESMVSAMETENVFGGSPFEVIWTKDNHLAFLCQCAENDCSGWIALNDQISLSTLTTLRKDVTSNRLFLKFAYRCCADVEYENVDLRNFISPSILFYAKTKLSSDCLHSISSSRAIEEMKTGGDNDNDSNYNEINNQVAYPNLSVTPSQGSICWILQHTLRASSSTPTNPNSVCSWYPWDVHSRQPRNDNYESLIDTEEFLSVMLSVSEQHTTGMTIDVDSSEDDDNSLQGLALELRSRCGIATTLRKYQVDMKSPNNTFLLCIAM
jgi:hypothetical protein